MRTLTNNELIMLALLAEEPSSGYELEKKIAQRGMREWTDVGFSSIYYLLQKLESSLLTESQTKAGSVHLSKKEYRLSVDGKEALESNLLERLTNPRPFSPDFAIGLAFSGMLQPIAVRRALEAYQMHLLQQIEIVKAKWQAARESSPHVNALFDHSLQMMQTELDWLHTFLKQQQNQKGNQNE